MEPYLIMTKRHTRSVPVSISFKPVFIRFLMVLCLECFFLFDLEELLLAEVFLAFVLILSNPIIIVCKHRLLRFFKALAIDSSYEIPSYRSTFRAAVTLVKLFILLLCKHKQDDSFPRYVYSSQLLTVLGNGTTSLMFDIPVRYITHLSKPRPNPACLVLPYLRRSR